MCGKTAEPHFYTKKRWFTKCLNTNWLGIKMSLLWCDSSINVWLTVSIIKYMYRLNYRQKNEFALAG